MLSRLLIYVFISFFRENRSVLYSTNGSTKFKKAVKSRCCLNTRPSCNGLWPFFIRIFFFISQFSNVKSYIHMSMFVQVTKYILYYALVFLNLTLSVSMYKEKKNNQCFCSINFFVKCLYFPFFLFKSKMKTFEIIKALSRMTNITF